MATEKNEPNLEEEETPQKPAEETSEEPLIDSNPTIDETPQAKKANPSWAAAFYHKVPPPTKYPEYPQPKLNAGRPVKRPWSATFAPQSSPATVEPKPRGAMAMDTHREVKPVERNPEPVRSSVATPQRKGFLVGITNNNQQVREPRKTGFMAGMKGKKSPPTNLDQ